MGILKSLISTSLKIKFLFHNLQSTSYVSFDEPDEDAWERQDNQQQTWAWPHGARFSEHVPPTALPAWSQQTFGLCWEGSDDKTDFGFVGCAVYPMTEHHCGAETAIDYSKTNGHNCASMKLGLHTLKMVIMQFPCYRYFSFDFSHYWTTSNLLLINK